MLLRNLVGAAILGLSFSVMAAPPSGHPTVEQTNKALKLPPTEAELNHEGKVLQVIPSNDYVYIEAKSEGLNLWLAAPATEVKKGDTIRFPNGTVMSNFFSKRLQRTFDEILFVGRIKVVKK